MTQFHLYCYYVIFLLISVYLKSVATLFSGLSTGKFVCILCVSYSKLPIYFTLFTCPSHLLSSQSKMTYCSIRSKMLLYSDDFLTLWVWTWHKFFFILPLFHHFYLTVLLFYTPVILPIFSCPSSLTVPSASLVPFIFLYSPYFHLPFFLFVFLSFFSSFPFSFPPPFFTISFSFFFSSIFSFSFFLIPFCCSHFFFPSFFTFFPFLLFLLLFQCRVAWFCIPDLKMNVYMLIFSIVCIIIAVK